MKANWEVGVNLLLHFQVVLKRIMKEKISNELFEFKEECDKHGILLSFYGYFSQELLVEIGDTLRNRMKLDNTNSTKMIKIFAMFIEQAQNIIHYSAEKSFNKELNCSLSNGVIVVGYQDDLYYVLCGNQIDKKNIELLTKKLTTLHNMNKNELKYYYKKQRKSLTTGLGFIELARKSVKPIDFDFQSIDEQFSFFSLKTYI